MVVRLKCIGHRLTGLYIGANNVRRYFPRQIAAIDLQLDHLRIRCGLTPEFWQDAPEIRDPRLSDWLELKRLHGIGLDSMPMAMTPSGEDSFILGPALPSEQGHTRRTPRPSAANAKEPAAFMVRTALPN
jgi:hypothetical protein